MSTFGWKHARSRAEFLSEYLTDEEKLLAVYGKPMEAVSSLRYRVGSIVFAKRILDEWTSTDEYLDLGGVRS